MSTTDERREKTDTTKADPDNDEGTDTIVGADRHRPVDPDDPRKADAPTDLHSGTWFGVLKRSAKEFGDDQCTDWAAALTYYGVLALFPALLVVVALVGVVGDGEQAVDTLLGLVRELGAQSAVEGLEGPIREVVSSGAAGTLLSFGVIGAVWSASGYVGAFMRASNAVYEVEEGRGFIRLTISRVLLTVVLLVLLSAIVVMLVVSGPVAEAIGSTLGIGESLVTVWQYGKWPVLLVLASLLVSILYWAAPNVRQPKFRWFTLGGLLALVIWALVSVAFGFYVANFGSYNATYGSLGAVIAFLVWVWVTNSALLFGAEINAEIERGRQLQAGQHAEEQLLLPPRAEKKDDEDSPSLKERFEDVKDRVRRD